MNLPFAIAELKTHCRIDGSRDDALLMTYAQAAIKDGQHKTNRDWSEWTAESFPEPLKLWVFLRVATFYELRTDLTTGRAMVTMPRSFADALLDEFWLPK